MRVSKVILTGVCDVENVRDSKSLNHMSIACVMPVSKIEATWKDLIWVVVGLTEQMCDQMADIRLTEV